MEEMWKTIRPEGGFWLLLLHFNLSREKKSEKLVQI